MKKIIFYLLIVFIIQNKTIYAQNPGVLDPSFNVGAGANGPVFASATQSNGKVIIGGNFTSYNGTPINRIARLNTDGSLDTTFHVGDGANGTVYVIKVLNNDAILIGGAFTSYNYGGGEKITMIGINGENIQSVGGFGPSQCNGTVYSISVQNDGKIIVGGSFTLYQSLDCRRIVRLDAFGYRDMTFSSAYGVNNGANNTIYTTAVQSNGKIIIGGAFKSFNGITKNRITRLNADGTIDTSFLGTGTDSTVRSITIQSDGKVLVGGDFTKYNGVSLNRIIRLNTIGTNDSGFSPIVVNNSVWDIKIQTDGKILFAGDFTNYGGTGINKISRLTTSGSIDQTFTPGTGANIFVLNITIQNDGKIIIGGGFTTINGISAVRIARLFGDCNPPSAPTGPSSQVFCGSATVSDLIANGSAIQWFASSSGGLPLSASTPLVSGNSYFAEQTVVCVSQTRLQVNVTINSLPTANISTIGSTTFCAGNSLTLNANSGTGLTYQWQNNGTNISGATSSSYIATTNGSYAVVITNSNNCSTTSNSTSITVNSLPNVNLGTVTSPVCVNNSAISLIGSPAGGVFSGNGVVGSNFNPAISGTGTFTVSYTYTDANNCTASASQPVIVNACVGLADLETKKITIYPNPTINKITIELEASLINNATIEIYDVVGKLVYKGQLEKETTHIDLGEFANGIYNICVGKEFKKTFRVVKE
jgi:uncharacterized delta-60 repeat protein